MKKILLLLLGFIPANCFAIGGLFITNNGTTLQPSATFYVSSGTAQNFNTNVIKFPDGSTQVTAALSSATLTGLKTSLNLVPITVMTSTINFDSNGFTNYQSPTSVANIGLNPNATYFVLNSNSLVSGSTFYVSSGSVKGAFSVYNDKLQALLMPSATEAFRLVNISSHQIYIEIKSSGTVWWKIGDDVTNTGVPDFSIYNATTGIKDISISTSDVLSVGVNVVMTPLTASRPVKTDSNKQLTSGLIDLTSDITGIAPDANLPSNLVHTNVQETISSSHSFTGGLSASEISVTGLTSGNCVQTGTGGVLTVSGSACGSATGNFVLISTGGTTPQTGGFYVQSSTIEANKDEMLSFIRDDAANAFRYSMINNYANIFGNKILSLSYGYVNTNGSGFGILDGNANPYFKFVFGGSGNIAGSEAQIYDNSLGKYVSVESSGTIPTSFAIVQPSLRGTAGQVRTITNVVGTAVYEDWETPSSGGNSIYNATSTAGFPFGLTVTTITADIAVSSQSRVVIDEVNEILGSTMTYHGIFSNGHQPRVKFELGEVAIDAQGDPDPSNDGRVGSFAFDGINGKPAYLTGGEIEFISTNTGNYMNLMAPDSMSTTYDWHLPSADGSGCIQSDGSGNLSISSCGGGGGGYALEPATVTIQAVKGIVGSTTTLTFGTTAYDFMSGTDTYLVGSTSKTEKPFFALWGSSKSVGPETQFNASATYQDFCSLQLGPGTYMLVAMFFGENGGGTNSQFVGALSKDSGNSCSDCTSGDNLMETSGPVASTHQESFMLIYSTGVSVDTRFYLKGYMTYSGAAPFLRSSLTAYRR